MADTFPVTHNGANDDVGLVSFESTTTTHPVTVNGASLDFGLVAFDSTQSPHPATFQQHNLDIALANFSSGPWVSDMAPSNVCVPATPTMSFRIRVALPALIDLPTVVVTISINGGAPATVYTSSAYQAGYSGSATDTSSALESIFSFSFTKTGGFMANDDVQLFVTGDDDGGNPIDPDPTIWTFCIVSTLIIELPFISRTPTLYPPELVIESPVELSAVIRPDSDTIRGGKFVVAFATAEDGSVVTMLNTSKDRSFRSTSLPMDYTDSVTGSGRVSATTVGAVLQTGLASGSTAQIASSSTVAVNFDTAIDVEVLDISRRVADAFGQLEFKIAAGSSELRIVVQLAGSDSGVIGVAWSELDGVAFGGTQAFEVQDVRTRQSTKFTLRIVRALGEVFCLTGIRTVPNRYVSVEKLGNTLRFEPEDDATVSFSVENSQATAFRVRFSNLTFRSHSTIDGQLLDNKLDANARQITGSVPATKLERRGLRDIEVFGLFGYARLVDGFEYTLSTPETLGVDGASTVTLYQDETLRDGSD